MSEDLSIRVREFLKQASTTMEATEQMEKIALSPKYMLAAARKAKKLGRTELKRLTSMESVPGEFEGVRYRSPEGLVERAIAPGNMPARKITRVTKDPEGRQRTEVTMTLFPPNRPKGSSRGGTSTKPNAKTQQAPADATTKSTATGISKSDVAGAGAGSVEGAGAAGEKADSLFSKGKQKAYEAWDKGKGLAKAHPVLAAGIGAVGTGGTTGILGYNMGHSSGQEDTAKLVSDYYKIREAMLQQQLAGANSSLWNRIANVFGAGDLSAIAGGGLDFGAAPVSAERASKVLDELAHQDDIRRSLGI